MNRVADAFARLVTKHRALTVGGFLVVAGAMALALPTLVADPFPQRLTASSVADQERVADEFQAHFGNSDHVTLVLIDADDVLAPEPLAYIHRLSVALSKTPRVARVESITITPLALPSDDADEAPVELESLEDLDLDALEDTPQVAPALEEALGALVRAAPERFPLGLGTLAERLGSMRYGPAVEGETVEPEERERLIAALADAPLIERKLISQDRRLAAIAVLFDESVEDYAELDAAVRDLAEILDSTPRPDGVEAGAAGLPQYFRQIAEKIREDNIRTVPATLFVSLILLYLSFRWLPGTFLPLVSVAVSTVVLLGAMALFGEKMNVINNILPPLIIIIGVSEAIHVIGRYRQEVERGLSRLDAMRETVRNMTLASFLTTGTTAAGLGALVASETVMLGRFGLIAAAGVMLVYLVTILFLPAAMSFFSPPKTAKNTQSDRRAARWANGWLDRAIVVLTRVTLRRYGLTIVGAALVTIACIWAAFYVRIDSALFDELDSTDPLYHRLQQMETQLQGVRPLEVMLTAAEPMRFDDPDVLAGIENTQRWLREQPGVVTTLSIPDFLHESWAQATGDPTARAERLEDPEQIRALLTLLRQSEESPLQTVQSADGRVARIHVSLTDIGARATIELIEALEAKLEQELGAHGIDFAMTGEGYTGSIGLNAIVDDLLGGLGAAVLMIFGMVVILFRSLRLGLLSVPPNVIPLVGAIAWMTIRGVPLNAATVIIFSISLGLAVNASIHIIARFREELARGFSSRPAILRAARGTGRSIIISFVTLMIGFGVLLLSSFVPVRRFGELIAVSMGLSLLATLIVQPAMLRIGFKSLREAERSPSQTKAQGASS